MINVDKLTDFDHILVRSQLYLHTVDHDPPWIRHKLPRSDAQKTQQLYYERVDGEPKPVGKSFLIEAHFPRKEMLGPVLTSGPTNTDTIWKLESVLEPTHSLFVQPTHLFKGMEGPNYPRSRDDCISPLRAAARW